MKRVYPATSHTSIFVEALEPRIAPAGLLNESKFTTVTLGTPQLLDASGGPNDFQGLTTGSGPNGAYLLYITTGKALVFTSDLNGNGRFDPGEITGIAAGVDSEGRPLNMILFSDVHGDIVTDLLPGQGVSQLSDSDNNPANGRDGRVLLDNAIGSITLRTLTAADIDTTIPGNTLMNRVALTSFSIYGNIYAGGGFGGLTVDTSGASLLSTKFAGQTGTELYNGSTPQIGDIYTGSAASNQPFHLTQLSGTNAFQGTLLPFTAPAGEHGGDISNIQGATPGTNFEIGTLATGNGGFDARGGNISNVTLQGNSSGYQLIAGDGGQGPVGAPGGSIIDFSDLGTSAGQVVLHTGSGGVGLLGVGGAGGTATFGTVNTAADVEILLGHGGNGFTGGGAGAGLPTATFTVPEGGNAVGGQFEGTYHMIGDVGNTHLNADGTYSPEVIDFNGDGIGDGVFTSSKPNQIVVVFGDGFEGLTDSHGNPNSSLASETIRLHAPGLSVASVVVADFNGDGKPDIAAVSNDPTNFGGVYVFLNQIGNPVLDPLGPANYTKNPLGAHPFSTPLQSAVPTLTDYGFYVGAGAIRAVTAGDFNGDGIMDIGYEQNVTLIDPAAGNPVYEAVGVLFGSAARDPNTGAVLTDPTTGHPEGTGYFYANPAAQTAAPLLQVTFFNTTDKPILKATSLASTNVPAGSTTGIPTNPEVLVFGVQGAGLISQSLFVLNTNPDFAELGSVAVGLGKVDTNRSLGATNISSTTATLQDFAIEDIDGDNNADLVILTSSPTAYLVTFNGDGAENFTLESRTGDNAGIFLGNHVSTAISALDANADGRFAEAAVLQFTDGGVAVIEFSVVSPGPVNAGVTLANLFVDELAADKTIQGLDGFYEQVPSAGDLHPAAGIGVLTPTAAILGDTYLQIYANGEPFLTDLVFLTYNGFRIYSGDGGNAIIGAGGDAGSLGSGTLAPSASGNPAGSISITFPVYPAYFGSSFLSGGHGGNGFTSGGIGGDITGISAAYAVGAGTETASIQFVAGDGGDSVSGAGGRGGVLAEFSAAGGTFFTAGNGGTGVTGGAGGSVMGNQQGFFDTSTVDVTVVSGGGGVGATTGGTGGNISNFDAVFLPVIGGVGGSLSYVTGPGGNSAGGTAGSGGSITNSSPDANTNNLAGDITLDTGAGGNGLTGGSGGAITNFINQPTSGDTTPSRLNVVTGNGGIGTSGNGGAGGSITNFQANATGLESGTFDALSGTVRVVAGNGGASFAAAGGAGGSIISSTALATSTPIVVAAGAGGDGLTAGGTGGSVTDDTVSSAAQLFGKVLVIAGAGGDATAVSRDSVVITGDADTTDLAHALLAIGGTNGLGGNGGSISNFTQPTGAATAVDLIAGNGGSTINVGSPLDTTTGVGVGGSVTNVNLVGTVGSITRDLVTGSNPPIRAYNDLNGDGVDDVTIAAFVNQAFGGTVSLAHTSDFDHSFIPNNPDFALDDAIGNVGIVAGRSGQVKGGQGAADGVNGSVEGITAGSILSIVAGSVNNVAPVQVLSGITVTNPDGVLGADKSSPNSAQAGAPNSQLDYYDPTTGTVVQNLQPGDRLIDGALFAIEIDQPATAPFIAGPRVFSTVNNG